MMTLRQIRIDMVDFKELFICAPLLKKCENDGLSCELTETSDFAFRGWFNISVVCCHLKFMLLK